MVNYELYKEIVSSYSNNTKEDIQYYKKFIEENLQNKYKKILYIKDEIIIKEGIIDDYIYFIERGKVVLVKKGLYDRKFCYGYLFSGDFFGHSSFINMPEVVSYKALTNCYIYAIQKEPIKQLIQNNEAIREEFQRIIVNSIRTMTLRQGSLATGECRTSFVNFVKEYFKDYSKIDENGHIIVTLDINLAQIASILNMTRETLSRIVSEMKKEKIIETKRKYIKILDLSRFVV
ncbi:Crp/Fnr family transcriptional regulator [Caloramator sp. E03]|uniref:Crp/Fnr family transcriptional regulator n=1 Tax=Caloramator sp. E03 TaxID=2576307 RepID=UPI001110B3C5|nr:Crp/Fnr family transcriptional regulator [Caloramator sp. E03]QCX33938.1 Crp/Fnr family transcriptional regulator [Caloramator sp. E03]